MSHRPSSSSGSSRPLSSLSRPSSAASQPTISRVSHRPLSRFSQRPATRQSRALCQTLVTKITGLVSDQDNDYDAAYDLALRHVESIAMQAASPDLRSALGQLRRFSEKARIRYQEELAEALDITVQRLRVETEKRTDLDNEISMAKLSGHLQFIYLLAAPPSSSTLAFASDVIERAHSQTVPLGLTWVEILKEEPFEGQHWQGAYGLPAGSVVGQEARDESVDSSPTLSTISDSELDERDELFSFPDHGKSTDESDQIPTPLSSAGPLNQASSHEHVAEAFRLRLELEALRRRQYWTRSAASDVQPDRDFDLCDPSTLRSTFDGINVTDEVHSFSSQGEHCYLNEQDAVREVLVALQGLKSVLFIEGNNKDGTPSITIAKDSLKLPHLTPSAQNSILSTFADRATTLCGVRLFLKTALHDRQVSSAQKSISQTLEAFAEAFELQLIQFQSWMSHSEEEILRAHSASANGKTTIVSLLNLEKSIREEFSDSFEELLRIVRSLFPHSTWLNRAQMLARIRPSASSFSAFLLDSLFEAIQKKRSFGDTVTSAVLIRAFLKTAEPIWRMVGRWLHEGIFMPETSDSLSDQDGLPQEFFIESNGLGITDPDFWTDGYNICALSVEGDAPPDYSVPTFLRSLSDKILGAGKSIGLLRILGHSAKVGYGKLYALAWPTFETFIMKLFDRSLYTFRSTGVSDIDISLENLSLLLSDHLLPVCSSAEKILKDVLFMDCELPRHLDAIEDLFLSRKGDILNDFCDVLFHAIDAKKVWTDYHFLNTAFREIVDSRKNQRIESTLVRLSYKPSRNPLERSVRCFDGLIVEYAVPFPLVFILSTRASQVYNAIFVLLIKIRRAKTFLDNVLLRRSIIDTLRSHDELKLFYTTRSKLSWFVNSFQDFICSHVLQVETQRFRSCLLAVSSLDDMVDLHKKHLDAVEKLCLLDDETTAIQRAIRSILDMAVVFNDCFAAFAGDQTLDTCNDPASRRRRHKSRRWRRRRLDIVSFAPISSFQEDGSESSDSDLDELIRQEISQEDINPTFAAPSTYESFSVEDFFDQNEKMIKDLDSRVRHIRREVERLALTSGVSQFDILAFSLQDWDL